MDSAGAEGAALHFPWETPPPHGEAVAVAPGVLWMRLPLPMRLDHVNAFALEDDDGWTIVDTGFDNDETRAIWAGLMAGPMGGKPVRRVLVTHYHPDHIGLAGWFQTTRGAELWTTRTSWLFARMLTLDEQPRPSPEVVAFWRASGMDPALLARRATERPFNFADMVAPLPSGYRRLREGQEIRLGGRAWTVRMGHGHAPEHATLWSLDDALVIGGDQLLPGISPNLAVHANEPEADPVADWLESCERLAGFARPDQLILPGHKLPFTGLPFRLEQMAQNHRSALDRLEAHLAEPRRGGECFAPLFKREIGPGDYGLALGETVAHLNHLHQTGRARRHMDEDGAWRWRASS